MDIRPESLSGKFEGTFAYYTIRDRLPDILTKVIDEFSRKASDHHRNKAEVQAHDAKNIVSQLSRLKNEMQTDKTLRKLKDSYSDVQKWNTFLDNIPILESTKSTPTWYSVAWLYCECYLYRRIFEATHLSDHHKDFDPFLQQKSQAFFTSEAAMKALAGYVVKILEPDEKKDRKSNFETLLEYSLWGNKCDLSISAGRQVSNQLKESDQLKNLLAHIISNQTEEIWQHLSGPDNTHTRIDFILDNAGFELFTDLCLAEFLLNENFCKVIYFHVKNIPWFVSDTRESDFLWTIQQCSNMDDKALQLLGARWNERIENGSFKIFGNEYWSLPNDFSDMPANDAKLYGDLKNSRLIIFKGDLNYRKLTGDRNWPTTTGFPEALNGFCPSPLCTLRTLKADLVVGLSNGKAEELSKKEQNWMTSGNYAVIQFCKNL